MLLLNCTLLSLHSHSSLSNSPFLSHTNLRTSSRLTLLSTHSTHHFSHFLFSSFPLTQFTITRSHFSHFLNSVISLTSLSAISGISGHDTNPVAARDSFTCSDATFSSNKTPFNGAAISVSLAFGIDGEITNTKFQDNSGGIGGAIFFAAPFGNLSISKSWFERNSASAGSHIFLRCLLFYSYDTRWIVSTGVRSGIETSTLGSFTLNQANFFRNAHGIRFGSETTNAVVENSCFLNYDDKAGFPENLGLFQGQANVLFRNTWVNKRLLNGAKKADEVREWLVFLEGSKMETAPAEQCRLIPTPSTTTDAKLNFDAWFSIISIGFFVIVSVLGIVMVTCCHSAPTEEPRGEPIQEEIHLKSLD